MSASKLGQHLRTVRNDKDLTLNAVASAVGVSIPFLSDVERGERTLTPQRLEGVLKALGVPRKATAYVRAFQMLGRLPPHVKAAVLRSPMRW